MPRLARSFQNFNYFHIMTKGINKEKIFYNDFYKNTIIKYYFEDRYDWDILAYAIMDNHTHFMVKVENIETLSSIMKSLNIRYSLLFNEIENRNGHIFQNRFKSVPIVSEKQLFECLRYIHNNPVFSYIVNNPRDYRFSSYRDFFIEKSRPISNEFIEMVVDNFRSEEEFLNFHNERIFTLGLDTREDTKMAKKYILNKLDTNMGKDNKAKLAKDLKDKGFTKVDISQKLGISRNRI